MAGPLLTEAEQEAIDASVRLLEEKEPNLGFPHTLGIEGSRHAHMRELRVPHEGRPYRVLYAFDQRRYTSMLVGGDKTGGNRWYDLHVPIADKLYDILREYVKALGGELKLVASFPDAEIQIHLFELAH